MKITSIQKQIKRTNRYSIYIDEKYSFSLSESALIDQGLAKNQELSEVQVSTLKKLQEDDKLFAQTLRYLSYRARSEWEITQYLKRKKAPPSLIDEILNKLRDIHLINDQEYAKSYVRSRLLSRQLSNRKLVFELKQKHIEEKDIKSAVDEQGVNDQDSLIELIEKKKQQSKYSDDLKLMQYLSRQGFNYEDIKSSLQKYKS